MAREKRPGWPLSNRPNVFVDLRYPNDPSEGFMDVRDPRWPGIRKRKKISSENNPSTPHKG